MLTECRALGLTPLTAAEFAEEDKRMYRDLMRRREGDYGNGPPVPIKFGTYR